MARRKKRQYGGLRCERSDDGIWYIVGTPLNGSRVRKSTRTRDFATAERIRLKLEQDLLTEAQDGRGAVLTFGEVVAEMTERDPRAFDPYPYWPDVLRHFSLKLLKDVDHATLMDAEAALFRGTGHDTRKRHLYSPVKKVLKFAAKKKYLPGVPYIENPQPPTGYKRKKVTFAPDPWIEAFMAGTTNARLRACLALMTTTGLRAKEACSITPAMVDWERGRVELGTKTTDQSGVKIPRDVLDMMATLAKDCEPTSRLFGFVGKDSVNQALERECKRLGVPYYSTHQIGRHAFATRLLKRGRTTKFVAAAGRWASTAMVDKIYGHVAKEDTDAEIEEAAAGLKLGKTG